MVSQPRLDASGANLFLLTMWCENFPISCLFGRLLFAHSSVYIRVQRYEGVFRCSQWLFRRSASGEEAKVLNYSESFSSCCRKTSSSRFDFGSTSAPSRLLLRTFVCVAFEPIWNLIDKRIMEGHSLIFHLELLTFRSWRSEESFDFLRDAYSWPPNNSQASAAQLTLGYVSESTNWPSMPSRITDTKHVITPNSMIVLQTGCDCWITLEADRRRKKKFHD